MFIPLVILIVVVMGIWGYLRHPERMDTDPLSLLYDTLLAFKMESYEPGAVNWQLLTARYLAAFVVGYSIYIIVLRYLRKGLSYLRIRLFYRDHTIIAGLGLKGYLLAHDLKEAGEKVVIIENNPESIYIEDARKERMIVLSGDAMEKRCWLNAGLLKARRIILVMDNDDKNIEAVTLISEISGKRKQKEPIKGQIHIEHIDNYNLLKDYLDIHQGTIKLDLNIFNTHILAAQRLWDLYPPHDNEKDPLGANISILILGYMETTRAFLVENMILSRYKDPSNIKVVLFTPNSEQVKSEIYYKLPFIDDFLDLEVIEQDDEQFYREPGFRDEFMRKLKRVYVFGTEDADVVLKAKSMKQVLYKNYYNQKDMKATYLRKPAMVLCLPEKTRIIEFLNEQSSITDNWDNQALNKKLSDNFDMQMFRLFSDACCKRYLIDQNEIYTLVAKVTNYFYYIKHSLAGNFISEENYGIIINNSEELQDRYIQYEANLTKTLSDKDKSEHKKEFEDELLEKLKTDFQEDFLDIELNLDILKAKRSQSKFYRSIPDTEAYKLIILELIEQNIVAKIKKRFKDIDLSKISIETINARWQKISDREEDSNIYTARHAALKLLYNNEGEVEWQDLAPMEHKRWMAEKLVFQFRHGPFPEERTYMSIAKKDLKIHNLIVPFNSPIIKGQKEEDKDIDLFRLLKLVKQINTILENNSSIQHTKKHNQSSK